MEEDAGTKAARLIEIMTHPDFFQATEEISGNRADEHEVVGRLREVLSRAGVVADLRTQPRSAATDFLLWAAERFGIEG